MLTQVNTLLLETLETTPDAVQLVRVEDAEMDYMWSFVESKKQERWLWHALNHQTGQLLAYVLAPHHDAAFKQLQSLRSLRLAFNISIPTVGARMSVISTHNNIPLVKPTPKPSSANT